MNILILNWRDPKNPKAGGAEKITQKYAQYWIKNGHTVLWISNLFEGEKKEEVIEGVKYLRVGPSLSDSLLGNLIKYPLYLFMSIVLAKKLIKEAKVDLVIDEIHGFPFFTPFYSNKRNILLVCEVAGVIWNKMFPFPINFLGRFFEKFIYKVVYKNTEIWAISQNTQKDILSLNPKAKVKILPLGIETEAKHKIKHKILKKYSFPSAVFLARLVKMKGVEVAIEAAEKILKKLPNFRMFVIGKGDKSYESYLKNMVKKKGLGSKVEFLGYVSEEKKYEILSKCHFLFHPSYKEGFGLTVLEAGLVGTPSIVQKGSSLEELVENGKSGFVVNGAEELSEKFISSVQDKSYPKLSIKAREKALKYSWKRILSNSYQITKI